MNEFCERFARDDCSANRAIQAGVDPTWFYLVFLVRLSHTHSGLM